MAPAKVKSVFTAEVRQVARIRSLVKARRYKTTSEFLREAIDDKLGALERERLDAQVARYCDAGASEEDRELIDLQAFDEEP
jgi:Arc/MetJ-type ribon-helix-helix transcriptional regulator